MNRPIEAYTSLDFLNNLLSNRPGIGDWDKFISWGSFINLLAKDAQLKLAFTKEDLELMQKEFKSDERVQGFIQYIINNYIQSQVEFEMTTDDFTDETRSANPYKFLFEEDKKGTTAPSINYGIPSFTPSSFETEWPKMSQTTSLKISKFYADENSVYDWNDIEKLKLPIHSMIICDQFIFAQETNLTNNVFHLLKSLIGINGLNQRFDLTIVFTKVYEVSGRYESLRNIYRKIEEFFQNELNINNLNLTLVKMKRGRVHTYHDRHIFTNAYTLTSSNSFSFFDDSGNVKQKDIADIEVKPSTSYAINTVGKKQLSPSYFKSHLNFINDIIDDAYSGRRTIGSCRNRLLTWVATLDS